MLGLWERGGRHSAMDMRKYASRTCTTRARKEIGGESTINRCFLFTSPPLSSTSTPIQQAIIAKDTDFPTRIFKKKKENIVERRKHEMIKIAHARPNNVPRMEKKEVSHSTYNHVFKFKQVRKRKEFHVTVYSGSILCYQKKSQTLFLRSFISLGYTAAHLVSSQRFMQKYTTRSQTTRPIQNAGGGS